MEEQIIAWVSLLAIFLIPLASLVPRMLRKRIKNKENNGMISQRTISEKRQSKTNRDYQKETQTKSSNFQPKTMLVLGEIVRGVKTFENIQKNTGFGNKELDKILENLEKNQLLKVQQKKGLLGIKIELQPTEKGSKEYFSSST